MKAVSKQLVRGLVWLFIVAVLLAAVPLSAVAKVVEPPLLRYGRVALAEENRAETLLYAYDRLVEAVADTVETVWLDEAPEAVAIDELSLVYEAVISDYPEFFWVSGAYTYSIWGDRVLAVYPQYDMTGEALETAKAAVEAEADALLVGLKGASDYLVSLVVYHRLANHVTYAATGYHQTVYGALVQRTAVCAGYASAYQYLLNRMGIPAWKIIGYAGGPHAWTMECLNGDWYLSDPTWDDADSGDTVYHNYFNVTTREMEADHSPDSFYARHAPTCEATADSYANCSGGAVYTADAFSAEEFRQLLLTTGATEIVCTATGDVNEFLSACYQCLRDLDREFDWVDKANTEIWISGQTVRVIHPVDTALTVTLHTGNVPGDVTLRLCGEDGHTTVRSVTLETVAGEATYTFSDLPSGSYALYAEKAGCVTRAFALSVSIWGTDQEVQLTPIGDLTGEGSVTEEDAAYLLYHSLLPEIYPANQTADYNGDGQVDSQDAVYLLYATLLPESYPLW